MVMGLGGLTAKNGASVGRPRIAAPFVFGFFGLGMIAVGLIGNALQSITDLELVGTSFEEGATLYVVYGAALSVMGGAAFWAPKMWGRTIGDKLVLPLSLLGVAAEKIQVIPHGVGAQPRVEALPEGELRGRLGLGDRPVVLSVSAKRPHKNLPRLIEALAAVPAPERPVLVVPGYPTSHEDELRAQAARLGVSEDLRLLGWVDAEELEGLYAAAVCVVYPTLAEGFGLPVLEAMRRGVPVACSGTGAVREVAAGGALLFDPLRTDAITAAMQTLLADRSERERLRAAGLARAAEFTWERSARGHLAAYERVLSAAPRHGVKQVPAAPGG